MNPKLVVFQHVAMEGPARVAHAALRAGIALQVVRLHLGEPVPRVAASDLLVVMGGPMGVGDVGNQKFPFLAAEVALLKSRLEGGHATLGICLGAQLLAHAAGARVYANARANAEGVTTPVIELGWAPVHFHGVAAEPCLQGLNVSEVMLHWHGDTFDLPAGAVHLASTPLCAHQAYRLGGKIFGLQFHCEADYETVEQWVQDDAAYVRKALGSQGAAAVLEQTRALTKEQKAAGDQLLDNLLACMLA